VLAIEVVDRDSSPGALWIALPNIEWGRAHGSPLA